jgi:hypothetical protein
VHFKRHCRNSSQQTRGKEWMHASLNAVDISNTEYNIVFCFLISV